MFTKITPNDLMNMLKTNVSRYGMHIDGLNYMIEDETIESCFEVNGTLLYAEKCKNGHHVFVIPSKEKIDSTVLCKLICENYSHESICVDIPIEEDSNSEAYKKILADFSAIRPYKKEITDYLGGEMSDKNAPLNVRELTIADKDAFLSINFPPTQYRPPLAVLFSVFVEKRVGKILGFFDGEKIIGFLSYQKLIDSIFDLDYIFVSEENRNKGIGKALGRAYAVEVQKNDGFAFWSNPKNEASVKTAVAIGFSITRRALLFAE